MSFCNEIQHEWFNIFLFYADITTDFLPQTFGLDAFISLLIAEVPKKLNNPAVEWAVVLMTRSTNIYKHY